MKKKAKKQEEPRDTNAWMATFSDLLTLLLTFFVLLLTMSSLDDKKMEDAFGFFRGALGALNPGTGGEVSKICIISPRTLLREAFSGLDFHDKKLDGASGINKTSIQEGLKSMEAEEEIEVSQSRRGVMLRMPDQLLFKSGEAKISPRAFSALHKISSVLGEFRNSHVMVEGHTDDLPINTKQFPSNWELSIARAVNVVKFLIDKGNIPPERLSSSGYGNCKPIFPNNTELNRERNRRVEILLTNRERG